MEEGVNPGWAVAASIVAGGFAFLTLLLRQRHDRELKRLDYQARMSDEAARAKTVELERNDKAREIEAARRDQEDKERRKTGNEHYTRLKEIADMFKAERDSVLKQLEAKCAECIELRIHLEEARKKLGEHDG